MANGIISTAAGLPASTPQSGGMSDMPFQANPMTTGEAAGMLATPGTTGVTSTPVAGGLTSTPTNGGLASTGYTSSQVGAPSQWNVTPNQTVEGRLPGLMNENNPIIQQAMTASNENMNSRGMLNSSMATTAGLSAAYGVAMPIANADAAASQKSAAYNADQINQVKAKNVDVTNQANQFSAAQNNALQGTQMDQVTRVNLQQMQNDNSKLLSSNTHAAAVFQSATSALNNIATSTTMDATTKSTQSAQVFANLQSQLRVLSSIAGLDLASVLGGNPYGAAGAPAPAPPPPAAPTASGPAPSPFSAPTPNPYSTPAPTDYSYGGWG